VSSPRSHDKRSTHDYSTVFLYSNNEHVETKDKNTITQFEENELLITYLTKQA
jgi:hypothetical protein